MDIALLFFLPFAFYSKNVLFTFLLFYLFTIIGRIVLFTFSPFTFLPLKIFVLPIYFILRIFAPEKIKNEYV